MWAPQPLYLLVYNPIFHYVSYCYHKPKRKILVIFTN